MKKLIVITAALLFSVGCTSTVTVGPKANETGLLGASASVKGVSLKVPLVSAEVKPALSSDKK